MTLERTGIQLVPIPVIGDNKDTPSGMLVTIRVSLSPIVSMHGDIVLTVAFGAGLTWGANVIQF